ncbi:hypothetical protein [Arachidicoccus terrestris]|uniref:hypothetical protein n=1 Tax=Arachidicoccus terrestris TaxID=2875539 RepID=UPI001CC6CD19|nr:hypothetical protein [Arachidicoccus terrestris]UAY53758.1 hypothetical protein K9M52_09675 [Arachidicoccus terrestris]
MMYDKERIYATKWQHVVETAVNDSKRAIVESFLKENCLTIAQIAKGCGLEIEEVEAINDTLKNA